MKEKDYHAMIESLGHQLIRDDEGGVDIFVMDFDIHNGPGCALCGESWCHHCQPSVTPCDAKNGGKNGNDNLPD